MTIPQQPRPYAETAAAPYPVAVAGPRHSLAAAIAVFLGGYLLLAGFNGFLGQTSISLFATLADRPSPAYPLSFMVLASLQFVFALIVISVGLILGRVSAPAGTVGIAVVVIGSLLTFVFIGLRFNGLLPFPGGRDGIPFNAVFTNSWFAIVLFVGAGWLIARGAKLGWLSILGTLVLIPLPIAFQFAGVENGIVQLVMYLLCGIVGAGIILAGRPFGTARVRA